MRVLIGASQVGNDFMQFNVEDPIRSHHFFLVSLIFFFFIFGHIKEPPSVVGYTFPIHFPTVLFLLPTKDLGRVRKLGIEGNRKFASFHDDFAVHGASSPMHPAEFCVVE